MPIYALGDRVPSIDPAAFVHPDAIVIGDVRIGPESSVWPCAVLRGDHGTIIVGARTSIQDGTVVHCTSSLDTTVGDRCVIGHNVHLEGCTIHDDSLVGSGSVVLHRAVIGPVALVGAGAVVGNDKVVPPGARALGVPARIVEDAVRQGEFEQAVETYVRNVHWYASSLRRLS
ncbi:MAG: gamma carbonic anhydrase family protein [Actinomycetales bacterium]|nr:gamma carbonic anhydrase family protein [Actinomycetales bacterium]